MRAGLTGTDAYLEQWRRAEPRTVGDDLEAEADAALAEIVQTYSVERVRTLVGQSGFADPPADPPADSPADRAAGGAQSGVKAGAQSGAQSIDRRADSH